MQARQAAISALPRSCVRKPKRLLSGLMRCGLCGSAMTLNAGKYNCSGHRERGTCSNGKIIAAQTVEPRVLVGIRSKLLAPEAMAKAVEIQREAAEAERKTIISQRLPMERELAGIERKLARAKEMFLNGMIEMAELEPLVRDLKARKQTVETKLTSTDEPAEISLHPSMAQAYASLATPPWSRKRGGGGRTELRGHLERVDFRPLEGFGKFELRVHGKLKALLAVSERAFADPNCGISVGAGTRSGRYPTVIPVVFAA